MDFERATKYCERKFGSCVCKKNGEVNCEKILREYSDERAFEEARREKDKREIEKRSLYITDDDPYSYPGYAHYYIAEMQAREMLDRYLEKVGIIEQTEYYLDRLKREGRYDFWIPKRDLTSARLGLSDKEYVKFHPDPVRTRTR